MKLKKYNILKKNKIFLKNYFLVPIRKCDIQNIRKWRNDQINILRQVVKLTANDQLNYYDKYIKNSFYSKKPNMILFSFLLDDICIGYGGLVHINWKTKTAEVSFLNNTLRSKSKIVYQKDLSIFLKLLFTIAFDDLKLNKLVTETYDVRPWTIEILEKSGFKKEKILKNHVIVDDKLCDSILHSKLINN